MALQKPEWFKLDAAKFLSDAKVDAMSTLELGACIRLLCRQWLDGSIPDDLPTLARLCRLEPSAMTEAWPRLCGFFPVLEPGKRANRFMFLEREAVTAKLEHLSDEGTRAAKKRWDQVRKRAADDGLVNPNSMGNPMQDQTRVDQTRAHKTTSENRPDVQLLSKLDKKDDSSIVEEGNERPTKEPSQQARKLAALLKAEILRNKADFRVAPKTEQNWAVTADRMMRIDSRSEEQIAKLIRWVQADDFWAPNILSMDKLRKKFDELEMKAARSTTQGSNPTRHTDFGSVDYKAGLAAQPDGSFKI